MAHYAALGVAPSAPADAVRRAYKAACLAHHPDKQAAGAAAGARAAAAAALARAQAAWAVLGDAGARARYDAAAAVARGRVVTDTLRAAELAACGADGSDADGGGWRAADCRCGGRFVVAAADLAAGVDTVPCDTCSLAIRVER